jgi:hypothetical protein
MEELVFKWNELEVQIGVIGEQHRLKLFENRVLRRIFNPNRDEVTGD